VQDISQLRTQYTRDEADLFLNITGNVFCGQVGGDSAKWVCERFPRIQQEKPSISANSTDTSVSTTLQWESTVNQATIAGLSAGEFVGVLSDDPNNSMELKVFNAKILREEAPKEPPVDELPLVREVDEAEVRAHFQRIKEDIKDLVTEEYDRITAEQPNEAVEINRALLAAGEATSKSKKHEKGKPIRGRRKTDQAGTDQVVPVDQRGIAQ
jgi:hypothetical protein